MPSNFNLALTVAVLPDAILVVLAGVCALLGVLRPRQRATLYRWIACIALAGAVASSGYELFGMRQSPGGVGLVAFGGGLVADHMSVYVTIAACAFAFIVCLLSDSYLKRIRSRSSGFFALVLMSTAALSALAGERNMITFFVALQTLAVCLGLITALVKTDDAAAESSFKLLLEGAIAAAVLLYGFAILYGATGSADLSRVAAVAQHAPLLVALGSSLVLVGLTFSAGLIPFRRWLRRTSEHVPAIPAGFVLTIGMSAGAIGWLRAGVSGFGGAFHVWVTITAILVAASSLYAALAALRESNLRRLIAHMASVQSAALILGVISFSGNAGKVAPQGPVVVLFSLAIFSVGLLAVYAVLNMLENAGVGMEFDDLKGMGQRSPPSALLLSVTLASLVGLPPLAGFIARILLFESAVGAGLGWLVIVMLGSTILLATALGRLIAAMYAEAGDERPFTVGATPPLSRSVALACCAGVFLLGVITQPLLTLASGGAGPLL
jgi:NADH-quinone oxidoreductase subunit N